MQFNGEGSKVLVTSGSKVKFVKDTDSEGNAINAVQATTTHTGSTTTPFTINLGGQYKVSEIAGIQVTYKIESGKNGAWLGIYVNEKMSDYSADRVASITYKEEKTPVYVTKTITQKDLLTKLDKTDPITALSIIDKDNNADDRTYTIRIDSITFIPFEETLLQFNSEESKALVTSGSNVSLIDDANATDGKAMQAKATHTSSSAKPFTINLGGKYKVSEVASIQVRYRITVGESRKIMGFYLNEINDYSSDRVASKTYSPMENYETVTITQDAMLKNGLKTDAYLSTLSLIAKDYADFTICIDSIMINLI